MAHRWPVPRVEADRDLEQTTRKYEDMARRLNQGGHPVFGALAGVIEAEQADRIERGGRVRTGALGDSVHAHPVVGGLELEMLGYGRFIRRQDPCVLVRPSHGGTTWGAQCSTTSPAQAVVATPHARGQAASSKATLSEARSSCAAERLDEDGELLRDPSSPLCGLD